MKVQFNFIAGIAQFVSCWFLVYKLEEVGVPSALVLCIAVAYSLLFPWKMVTVTSEEGESSDETSK